MRELMAVLKALADDNRVRVLAALDQRELCVCQIVELLGLANSTVSKHMAILKQARLVECRKQGRWCYYRLAGDEGPPEARELTAAVLRLLTRDTAARDDARRLREILQLDPEELCRRQCGCQ